MHAVLILVAAVYLFPLLYMVNVSLQDPVAFIINPVSVTKTINFTNYTRAWVEGGFATNICNSLLYTGASLVITLCICLLAAFPISREYIRGHKFFYVFFTSSLFLPDGLIPQFRLIQALHLYNTRLGYILLKAGIGLGFLILVGYIKSVPRELDDAAAIDGCGYLRYLLTVITPLIRPALATTALLHSIGVWNDVIGPVIYLSDKSLYPVVLGLYRFQGVYASEWTVWAAATFIVAVPLIVLYLFLQRYFIGGILAGALKT